MLILLRNTDFEVFFIYVWFVCEFDSCFLALSLVFTTTVISGTHLLSFYSVSTPLQYIEASKASKTDESVLGSGSNEVSEMIPVQWSESSDIKASYNQEL